MIKKGGGEGSVIGGGSRSCLCGIKQGGEGSVSGSKLMGVMRRVLLTGDESGKRVYDRSGCLVFGSVFDVPATH